VSGSHPPAVRPLPGAASRWTASGVARRRGRARPPASRVRGRAPPPPGTRPPGLARRTCRPSVGTAAGPGRWHAGSRLAVGDGSGHALSSRVVAPPCPPKMLPGRNAVAGAGHPTVAHTTRRRVAHTRRLPVAHTTRRRVAHTTRLRLAHSRAATDT
jgi:hypothetical protein